MPLVQRAWWKRLFVTQSRERKGEALKDLQAMQDDLKDFPSELKILQRELAKLEELEKERQVTREGILQVNLDAQAKLLDKILQRYGFFQDDVDINGIRIKEIARNLLKEAEKAGMKDLVEQKKNDPQWKSD